MIRFIFFVGLGVGMIGGCSTLPLPSTEGERRGSLSYVPIDPLPVIGQIDASCNYPPKAPLVVNNSVSPLLKLLPDQSVRMSIAQLTSEGEIVFTNAKVGGKHESYRVILDYMNSDTIPLSLMVKRTVTAVEAYDKYLWQYKNVFYKSGDNLHLTEIPPPSVKSTYIIKPYILNQPIEEGYYLINIPVYVGLGLRMAANITVNNGEVDISAIPSLAAKTTTGQVSGSLVVQTLGLTGQSITGALPLPNELNQTTVQNALLSIGTMKAMLNDPNTTVSPRIVGFDNIIGGNSEFVSAVRIAIAQYHKWNPKCL